MPRPIEPPVAERRPVILSAHGDDRVDDWYWLRYRDDPALLQLLDAEAAYLKEVTEPNGPLADAVYEEIVARVQLTDVTLPSPKGAWAYYTRTVEGLEYGIHCRRPRTRPRRPASRRPASCRPRRRTSSSRSSSTRTPSPRRPVSWSSGVSSSRPTSDCWRIRSTGPAPSDSRSGSGISRAARSSPTRSRTPPTAYAFSADGRTLLYTRADESMRPYQIWRHALGRPTGEDTCVWEESDPRFYLNVGTTKDGALIVLSAGSNTTSEVRVLDAAEADGEPRLVEARRQGIEYSIEHHRDEILVLSNDGAEFRRFPHACGDSGPRSLAPTRGPS